MDRDALLAAALGAAVLTGCTSSSRPAPTPSAAPVTPSAPPADPDVELLRAWARAESRAAARYAAVVRRVPALKALRDNHSVRFSELAAHLAARGADVARGGPAQPAERGEPRAVVARLLRHERELAAQYLAAAGRAGDPRVAVLGAECAAGARQHAAVLRGVRVPS